MENVILPANNIQGGKSFGHFVLLLKKKSGRDNGEQWKRKLNLCYFFPLGPPPPSPQAFSKFRK